MYLALYVPGKGSPSRPTFRSRPTLRSPNPSSVRIAVAQRRDVSPNRDPDAAAAAMEAQPPIAKGQPADAAAMEGQAPDATAMEDQPRQRSRPFLTPSVARWFVSMEGGGGQDACPCSGLGHKYLRTTGAEGAVSAIKQSRQIHV